jgi:vacuolar-type H+-ATPase subunit E/Vma4
MGQRELEAALRADGDNQARAIWRAAEAAAAQARRETEEILNQLEVSGSRRQQLAADRLRESILNAGRRQIRLCRLEAEQRLAERLLRLARAQLPQWAATRGAKLFHALVDEIPSANWRLVKVQAGDEQAAKDRFPNAEVVVSEQICGGLVVEDGLGQVIIINTLEKRLEHLWPELLPGLLEQLRQQALQQ